MGWGSGNLGSGLDSQIHAGPWFPAPFEVLTSTNKKKCLSRKLAWAEFSFLKSLGLNTGLWGHMHSTHYRVYEKKCANIYLISTTLKRFFWVIYFSCFPSVVEGKYCDLPCSWTIPPVLTSSWSLNKSTNLLIISDLIS